MISTDERSPAAGGDETRLHPHHNNNNGEQSLYYEYIPASAGEIHSNSQAFLGSPSPPSSPLLIRSVSSQSFNNPQQIVLRDHPPPIRSQRDNSSAVALQRSYSTNGLTDFIQHHLSSRLIPKLGSIVKRFSLNYSGEGLVTDRQRTRTVRVGIRFQVQVDSFLNNRQETQRPRAILRTQSAPAVEQLDSGFSSPTEIFPGSNRQLAALEYQTDKSSNSSVAEYCCGEGSGNTSSSNSSLGVGSGGIIIGGDSSSAVSSEASSPVLNRRQSSPSSTTLAFHNRINQALHSYRKSQLGSSPPSSVDSFGGRRSSVQVVGRGSDTPPERTGSETDNQQSMMEDSSSFQVLRHVPGSNVHSLNELNWETAAFEKEIRDRLQWIGDKVSSIRPPKVVSQLINFGKEYARENPISALILLALCLTSSAPVLLFLVFAVATILVTFLGFLFVEGTLLTVATVIFGGVILLVGFITLTAVLIGMVGYFTTTQAYLVVTGQSRIFRLLRKLPIIGRFFPDRRYSNTSSVDMKEEDEQISKLLNGMMLNGKMDNGYGSHDHDDYDDLLDSEDEEDLDETTAPTLTSSESDLGLHNGPGEEEDFGNQEVISGGGHKAQNNKISRTENSLESSSTSLPSSPVDDKSSSSPVFMNGRGKTVEEIDGEVDSDNSEL